MSDWFTPPPDRFTAPGDSRETSPFRPCSRCGGPNLRPDQRYCRPCATDAQREFRARQAEARKRIPEVARTLPELAAASRRAGLHEIAGELERLVKMIAPLARPRTFT